MGPRKDPAQKTIEFGQEEQPAWAKRLEEKLISMEERLVKISEVTDAVAVLDGRVAEIERRSEEKIKLLENRLNEFEFHQRKYNLIFFGLAPSENAEETVRAFLRDDLDLADAGKMPFQHCHPLPARDNGQPIIVRFGSFKDKEKVLKNLKNLRGKNKKVSVSTDLPRPLRERRKALGRKAKALRESGKAVRVVERGQEVRLEQRVDGRWRKIDED